MQSSLFKSDDDFTAQLQTKGLSAADSYAAQDEKVIFSSKEFAGLVNSAYNCDYQVTNVWPIS